MLGSSINTNCGDVMRARATASICCSPPERLPASCLRRFASTGKYSNIRSMSLLICLLVGAPVGPHLEVVEHAHGGEDEPPFRDVSYAEADHLVRRQAVDPPAEKGDLAGDRVDQPGDGAQERALACTVRADEGHDLALVHGEADIFQCGDGFRSCRSILDLKQHRTFLCPGRPCTPSGWEVTKLGSPSQSLWPKLMQTSRSHNFLTIRISCSHHHDRDAASRIRRMCSTMASDSLGFIPVAGSSRSSSFGMEAKRHCQAEGHLVPMREGLPVRGPTVLRGPPTEEDPWPGPADGVPPPGPAPVRRSCW